MKDPTELLVDLGDIELAVYHWPGAGDPVLLLHATGFHSRCWREVVRQLTGRSVYAADLRFHGGSGATGAVDWGVMAQDVRLLVEKLDLTAIVGAGHSIGGYLLARAAAQTPHRFRHLVLIDPVILAPERYDMFHRRPGELRGEDHPVSRRRNSWRDAGEMFQRFRERAPFRSWHPAVLRDYCDYALCPAGEEELRRLACDPVNEACIYLSQSGNEVVFAELPSITAPVTLLRAPPNEDDPFSLEGSPTWPCLAAALPNCREVYLPHLNHFIPMQDPALVARHILAAH